MTDIKVSLPKPCHASWDAMTPRGCNRHCSACDTIIHDLSLMTVDQAEALLDSSERICVRASVSRNGTVRTVNPPGRRSRRMVATIGTAVLLATAACQSVALPPVSPRYQISGQLQQAGWATTARLTSSDGRTRTMKIRGDRQFRFGNLRPGTYSLAIVGGCGEPTMVHDIVVSSDLDLGDIAVNDGEDCIIIGVMQRADHDGRG